MKQSIRLPFFIALLHLPIFFLKIGGSKIKDPPRKKIQINTIRLLEEPVYKAPEQKIIAANTSPKAPQKKTTPKKQPVQKKKTVKKKPQKKVVKKPTPKKVKKTVSKKKLQKGLKKSLAGSKSTPKAKQGKPKKIVKNDAGKAQREYNEYLQRIFEILSDSLTLPEQGKVKLAITVGGDGKVVKIETIYSESSSNLSYLQQNVSDLRFPKYSKKEDRTFTIVFSDEK